VEAQLARGLIEESCVRVWSKSTPCRPRALARRAPTAEAQLARRDMNNEGRKAHLVGSARIDGMW